MVLMSKVSENFVGWKITQEFDSALNVFYEYASEMPPILLSVVRCLMFKFAVF